MTDPLALTVFVFCEAVLAVVLAAIFVRRPWGGPR